MKRVLVVFVLVLVGCAAPFLDKPFPENPNHPATLLGNKYVVDSVTVGGAVKQLLPVGFGDGTVRVNFDATEFGMSGCNWWNLGPWSVENERLVSSSVAPDSTLIGCSEADDAQDRWLVGFLRSAPALAVDGNSVKVSGGDTVISLVYEGLA